MSMTPKDPTLPRVVLHVGAPKSGTTFLQRALWKNRSALAGAGYLLPGASAREMFLAAIEVRETHETWGFQRAELAGTWQRLAREARGSAGTTIMSHELLAAATEDQIAAALEELDGTDLHVVFTARDLGRQVVSEWQERIKNGSDSTFDEFERRITKRIRDRDFGSLFWRYQDLPGVLERWAGHLPPGNVHIVVAPPPGADPSELWRRFGDAVGFDADELDPTLAGRRGEPDPGSRVDRHPAAGERGTPGPDRPADVRQGREAISRPGPAHAAQLAAAGLPA